MQCSYLNDHGRQARIGVGVRKFKNEDAPWNLGLMGRAAESL